MTRLSPEIYITELNETTKWFSGFLSNPRSGSVDITIDRQRDISLCLQLLLSKKQQYTCSDFITIYLLGKPLMKFRYDDEVSITQAILTYG